MAFERRAETEITTVALKCGINIIRVIDSKRSLAKCPFCNDTKGKFYLTTDGDFANTFKCFKCGRSGSAIKLYAELKGLDTKMAYKELISDGLSRNIRIKKEWIESTAHRKTNTVTIENVRYLDSVYREFLSLLSLNNHHRKNLYNRGLTETYIKKYMYRSLPTNYKERVNIARKLLDKGYKLEGVPGFYKDKYGNFNFVTTKGMLIPFFDLDNNIVTMQIRIDDEVKEERERQGKSFTRYIYFTSSGYNKGSKSNVTAHIAGKIANIKDVYITEGPLKATIANYFSNETFIAIPGVAIAHQKVVDYLKKIKPERVIIAFDMDVFENKDVKRAIIRLIKLIQKEVSGIHIYQKQWNHKYKGIDDYLLEINKRRKTS